MSPRYLTTFMEPMFDPLYGLWFPDGGQWTLYKAYGVSEPVWVLGAYIAIYGGGAVLIARSLMRTPTRRQLWRLYWTMVAVAMVAEIAYVQLMGVYEYQDSQPWVVLGYPLFLGFVNSMSARKIRPYEGAYSTSKGALLVAVQAMAKELGPAGIRVNTVAPGWIWGPNVQLYVEIEKQSRGVDGDTVIEEIKSNIPLGFIPPSEDIASAILFFASDLSRSVTGQDGSTSLCSLAMTGPAKSVAQ